MSKRQQVEELRLSQIGAEFSALLHACLRECAEGRWGLLGRNENLDPMAYFAWPDAKRLKILAEEIQFQRHEFGQTNDLCERFLQLRALRGANVPGEPKLAAEFFSEISKT